jgi:hypothetical protein
MAEVNALRNGTVQGDYLIIGARALGLDCGPMSRFDNAGVIQDEKKRAQSKLGLPMFGDKFPTYDMRNDNVIRREVVPL